MQEILPDMQTKTLPLSTISPPASLAPATAPVRSPSRLVSPDRASWGMIPADTAFGPLVGRKLAKLPPPLAQYLGGVGACLKFSSPVSGVGNKVFASFFIDVPDCSGSFGPGQSSLHGYSAGFLPSSEIPSPNTTLNQNALPGNQYTGSYTAAPIFEKFNVRDVAATTWRPGVYDTDANVASVGGGPYAQKSIHFIVLSYEFNGGATLDVERVWIDPQASVFAASTEPTSGLGAGSTTSHMPAAGLALPDAGGFFFLANTQDGGATPNSGILFNSLSVGTSWAYVTGGPVFTTNEPYAEASAGQTLVLHPTAVAGGGVTPAYSWANSSGPLTLGSHYSVNATTGALTIANIQSSDADTYTLTATGVNSSTASAPTLVIVNTSQTTSGSTFTMNFTGPSGSPYRIWYSSNLELEPVLSTWTLATGSGASGNFNGGGNTYTDTAASSTTRYYTITSP